MKNYNNIREWLDTDPSPELITIILAAIKRYSIDDIGKQLSIKTYDLNKLEEAIKTMEDLELEIPKNINNKANTLRKMISEHKRQLQSSS